MYLKERRRKNTKSIATISEIWQRIFRTKREKSAKDKGGFSEFLS